MRRLWMLALVPMLTLALSPAPACARCSCVQVTEAQSLEHADTVFVGVLVGEDRSQVKDSSIDPIRIKFQVESVEKGTAGPTLIVQTANSDASCGWDYDMGHRYQVYVREGSTGLCSGNKDLGVVESARVDNSFPAVPTPFPWAAVACSGAVFAVIVAGFLLAARRRQDSA
jgi:hypothetical protein